MPIIRKRLNADELSSPNIRINPVTGEVEFWNGEEWIDAPQLDPRITTFLPPKTGGNAKCNTAASQVRFIAQLVEDTANGVALGTTGLAVAGILIGRFIFGFFPLVLAALAIFTAVAGQGASAVLGAFTLEVYDKLLCILFSLSDSDGFFDATSLDALHVEIDAEIGGIAAITLHPILALMGFGGLNTQGAAGFDTDDCVSCSGWSWQWEFTEYDGGFVYYDESGCGGGTWELGTGWRPTTPCGGGGRTTNYISFTMPSDTVITGFNMQFNIGINSPYAKQLMVTPSNYANRYGLSSFENMGGETIISFEGGYAIDGATKLFFTHDYASSVGSALQRIWLTGTGTMPTFPSGEAG